MNETYQDSAPAGPPQMSPKHSTIRSAEESVNTSDTSNQNGSSYNTAQSAQVETELANMRAMLTQFNVIMKQLTSTIEVYASKSRQLEAEQVLDQCADSKMLDDLLNNMRLDPRNDQQGVSSEPPPLPPRPNKVYTRITGSEELQDKPKVQSFNANENLQENVYAPTHFQKCDVNMNCANNPFDYCAANTSTAPLYNLNYQLPLKNDYQLDSTMWNDYTESAARQASAVPQASPATFQDPAVLASGPANFFSSQKENPPIVPQETQPKDPISLITPRATFEMSLEESAKSFFERLDAKCKSMNQETNPFKCAIESDKFEDKSSSPVAPSLPPRGSLINPFAQEANASQRDTISSTRFLYPELPNNYDFSSGNKTHSKLDAAAGPASAEIEREDLEAAKLMNVASWITQGGNPKPNNVNRDEYQVPGGRQPFDPSFTGDFPARTVNSSFSADVKTSNVLPSIPPRSKSPSCESAISREAFKAQTTDLLSTSNAAANHVEMTWFPAASNGSEFSMGAKESPMKNVERCEEKSQNDAAGPVMPEIKEERVRREKTGSATLPKIQEAEVWSANRSWDYKEIHLTKQTVHLINLDNEGWLTVDEFMTAFTTYKMPEVILKILDIQKAHIPFRFIHRVDYPTLFDKLERTSLAVPRNYNDRIGDVLQLAPLKSILKILRKLKIVDLKEVELATKKRMFPSRTSALYDACTIITIYANLQHTTTS